MHITGKKFFSTGSLGADMLLVIGLLNNDFAAAFVPKGTPGLVMYDDWRAIGQRGTASGTTELHDVSVPWELVIPKFLDEEGKLPLTGSLGEEAPLVLTAPARGASRLT